MEAFRYRDLLADGISRGQVRDATEAGLLTRVARGIYTDAAVPLSLVNKLRALQLALPTHAMFGFHTAAKLYGFGVVPSPLVHVVVPAGQPFPDLKAVATHQVTLPVGEPVEVAGLPCVPPERCAIDLARTCHRLDSLAVLDAALRSGRCTPESLAAEVARHDGLRGVRQARFAVPLADPRPECRQESQLRLVIIDGQLPAPQPQIWVYDEWGGRCTGSTWAIRSGGSAGSTTAPPTLTGTGCGVTGGGTTGCPPGDGTCGTSPMSTSTSGPASSCRRCERRWRRRTDLPI